MPYIFGFRDGLVEALRIVHKHTKPGEAQELVADLSARIAEVQERSRSWK